jgi:hypothetical protein
MKVLLPLVASALVLSACGGSSSPTVPGTGTNNGFIRFVNGSADTGAVDIYVDGNLTSSDTNMPYGFISAYQSFSTGTHTVKVVLTGTQTVVGSLSAKSVGINGGGYYSVVLNGENHPTSASNAISMLTFSDEVFSTPSGGAAVNFHNAASGLNSSEQFGYYGVSSGPSGTLGMPMAVGGVTGPQGLPSGVAGSEAVGFYAGTSTSISTTPAQVAGSSCSSNVMPCNSGNLSLYLIDGPAASTSPVAAPYPQGITASQTAGFVGIFDANGT